MFGLFGVFFFRVDAQISEIFSRNQQIPQAMGQTWQIFFQPHLKEAEAEEVAGLCNSTLSKKSVFYFQISQRNYLILREE